MATMRRVIGEGGRGRARGAAPVVETATLWVAPGGDDNASRAEVLAGGGAVKWATLGRAVWGNANRATPNASEAAQAGDVVSVAAGTYSWSGSVSNRWTPVYNPANEGTVTDPIVFVADGVVVLGSPNANAPIVGADGKDYIRWYADVTQGHAWDLTCDGRLTPATGDTVVNTIPDTGPCIAHNAVGFRFEGFTIDGGPGVDHGDQYNCFRLDTASDGIIRNNTVSNFRSATTNDANCTFVTMYGSPDNLVEHNTISNCGAVFAFKDLDGMDLQEGNIVRYNRVSNSGRVFSFSLTAEGRNFLYQNVVTNSDYGWFFTGAAPSNDWIYNNTFYDVNSAGVTWQNHSGAGGRFWNNIIHTAQYIAYCDTGYTMPADTVLDCEHNIYYNYTTFYSGSDGTRTFASYKTAFPDQDQASPASQDADPLFVNAAGGDFRLQGSSPAINAGVDLGDLDGDSSTTDAITCGAYITGNEVIGVET